MTLNDEDERGGGWQISDVREKSGVKNLQLAPPSRVD
jgi:hypothetical protein